MNCTGVLTHRFGGEAQTVFRELGGGVIVAEIDNSVATATISLYGGHVIRWQPKHQDEPVLWVSKLAQFKPGKAIRGGVPVCWPWFGSHPSDTKLPAHGYARISPWELTSVCNLENGATEIVLTLRDTEISRDHGLEAVHLSIRMTVGATLEVALTTVNNSDLPVVISEGLHTYFKVSDITNISVLGLDGSEYVDLLSNNMRLLQAGPIRFDGELGRIYMNNQATCIIDDPILRRRIFVGKSNSLSTAVWNPWALTSAKLDDLGTGGWRDMVCVESANALENHVTIAAGGSHTITASYSVENYSEA
jgi:glucose-6-phosphate 1-epimerase